MRFHTVCFDVGGTLVGGESMLWVLARELDEVRQEKIFKYLVESFMETYLDENLPYFINIKELLKMSVRKASREFNVENLNGKIPGLYRQHHMTNDFLYDDSLPTLAALKEKGIKLILVSDADADVLLDQLEMFGILKYFDVTVVSSNVEAYKPSDKVANEVLQHCSEPISQVLFVGDMIVDIKTARKIGAKSALINRDGEFKHEADYCIRSLSEIFDLQPKTVRR